MTSADARLDIRLTHDEKRAALSEAKAEGVSVSELVRRRLESPEPFTYAEIDATAEEVAAWKAEAESRGLAFDEWSRTLANHRVMTA